MNEKLINKIVSTLQYLAEQSSKEILITDRISTNKENYDRHFTSTSQLKFKLKHFGVRTSGAIVMLDGENQGIAFMLKKNSIY